ncbi:MULTISPECIES: hypothetical protein [unclassified Mesorhizobium]|uniref:hypothetical protein n=1 Tax=unclassified Mesorhizobium TaxID=325217 RepID=UPI000FCC11B6|nr:MULTISPECIES: hypothetical protein [unclassified Mesorhizobium]RUW68920.1 hypothetical protein EOA31_24575 [Mesorhizobium sp. M4B.F.Ca.ET.049.02.1.2]RVD20015.1 hypothetical protein EN738_24400 [Mesorhizobium sp. M4B.F.Ca.ET.017.02.2.1]RWC93656.1 MAG: hypothetical protein EOS32_20710 [Mesorhizobium sp.]TGV22416.1 hypothetical protein EN786_29540 [Mesorhizobium sp. M4B.F.Ca.ET.143.01.1.1]TIW71610.1 MAG: hypothetical protein E5V58_18640 [Mesorhizobium sp.]
MARRWSYRRLPAEFQRNKAAPTFKKPSRPKETALWAIRRHVVYFRFRLWRHLGTAIDGKNGDVLFANNLAMVAGLSYSGRK